MPNYKLTIGELFPADDVVAQWVYSVTSLAEDLAAITDAMKHEPGRDLRNGLYFGRLLTARLYEARRLVTAYRNHDAIRAFAKSLDVAGIDLLALYTRSNSGEPSDVENLYAESRHRAVHYPTVGSDELFDMLWQHRNFPARINPSLELNPPRMEFQWVTTVRARDSFGDWTDDDFLENMRRRSNATAAIAVWMMLASVLTVV